MRDIHPAYPPTTVVCACGSVIKTRSTRGDFSVDVCGACHPFYTGKQKLMDTAGRVDRFRRKFGETKAAKTAAPPQQVSKKTKAAAADKAAMEKVIAASKPEGTPETPAS